MMKKLLPRSPSASLLAVCIWCMCFVGRSVAQNTTTTATTDPSEVILLDSIFQQWGISPSPRWNLTGDPCTGSAVDSSDFNDRAINPALKCVCTFNNGTTCRITQLRIYAMNARGIIPEELGNLTKLFDLNLAQNYLTGPLPASIGKLTDMEWLSFGTNALYGTIPKELGNLVKLKSLSIATNNFSGPLPPELGNLKELQQMYISSSGINGPIPSTFSNLQNMETMWASDNEFTGNIPEFIGNWKNLKTLRLEGNSFEGPIPSSFSKLTKLSDLRIGDLSNGSSSLEFLKDMKSLSTLKLRNNKISGTIPANIGDYTSLQELDLSFNNLTGQIPDALFSLSSLSYLFLGNNSLSGNLPSNKITSLLNIDLSYNQLSGSFPTWIAQENLKLNLVANNFVIDSAISNVLSSGLNCLQRNFSCYRGSPVYYSFAINCGGPQITSPSGTVFELDDDTLGVGAASYYVTDSRRWAISNVGLFSSNNNISYTTSSSSQIINATDSELLQTARISPTSLRYYGLGLENGRYNISLQFAEIVIENSNTWKSVGRRVFNIYIQGNLALKDFDIKKEVGGSSFKAVEKKFQAQVSKNFLEIHLFWAGKGTCCVPKQGTYGPSISAISVTPDFKPTVSNHPPGTTSSKKKTSLVVEVFVPVGVVGFVLLLALFLLRRKRLRFNEDEELLGVGANTFSYAELRTATDNFNPENKLGEGGFGVVYKGTLSDGRAVAVKQLSIESFQGKSQFVTEISTISAVQHRNLVKLYGCCIEGDNRLLVYEYLENKSLDQALFGKSRLRLNWSTRYDICLEIARGLAYLHEASMPRIVHRDVKASNILLDANLNPKISDFGLAKLYDDKKTHISTKVAGTIGYLAPEYAMRGHLSEKADVFAFGVVALEILSGRPNSDASLEQEKIYLLEWAWYLHENDRKLELVDPTLLEFNEAEALRLMGVALLCTQSSPTLRPSMSRVVAMLSGNIEVSNVTTRPGYLTDWQLNEIISFMSGDDASRVSIGRTSENASTQLDGKASPMAAQPLILNSVIGDGR